MLNWIMRTSLTILGSGTCLSSYYNAFDFRYPSGYLIQSEETKILVDCSEGIRDRLNRIKIDYFTIGYIFISHFHPDHFSLVTFLQAFYVRAKKAKQIKDIKIYGPAGIEKRALLIWDNMYATGHFNNEFKKALQVDFITLKDKKEFLINKRLKVRSFLVPHGEMEAYSTRFNLSGKTICYSGDSGVSDNLVKSADNADLFICEAAVKCGETDKDNSHLNPQQAGEIAKKANCKALVLTHYHGSSSDREMLESVKASGFHNRTIVGKDLQKLVV